MTTSNSLMKLFGPWMPDKINVKSAPYNAVGDGVADDTTAVQNAIFASFGPLSNPNALNRKLNRPLYFPAGTYRITQPLYFYEVSGGVIYGDGSDVSHIVYDGNIPASSTFTVGGTTPFIVQKTAHGYVAGDAVRFSTSGTLPGVILYGPYYVISTGLTADEFQVSTTPGGSAFNLSGAATGSPHQLWTPCIDVNAMNGTKFSGISVDISGDNTVCITMDKRADAVIEGINVNGCQFYDVFTKNGGAGVLLGTSGAMGSEMQFQECQFQDHSFVGLRTLNGNALQGAVYNCVFRRCGHHTAGVDHEGRWGAISADVGSIQTIAGTTFVDSPWMDITSGGGEGYLIFDCHSTNSNVLLSGIGPMFAFIAGSACYMRDCSFTAPNATNHYVMWNTGEMTVIGSVTLSGCSFPNGIFREAASSWYYRRTDTVADFAGFMGTVITQAESLPFDLDFSIKDVGDLFG